MPDDTIASFETANTFLVWRPVEATGEKESGRGRESGGKGGNNGLYSLSLNPDEWQVGHVRVQNVQLNEATTNNFYFQLNTMYTVLCLSSIAKKG